MERTANRQGAYLERRSLGFSLLLVYLVANVVLVLAYEIGSMGSMPLHAVLLGSPLIVLLGAVTDRERQ